MAEKIHEGSARPGVYRFARESVKAAPEFDDLGEIQAVADAVKERVRFTRDPWRIESLQDPEDTLELGTGDCDDLAILTGAALQSIGVPVSLEVVGMGEKPQHVYLTARTRDGRSIPVDLARPDGNFYGAQPGWNYKRTIPLAGNPPWEYWRIIPSKEVWGKGKAQKKRSLRDAARAARGVRVSTPSLAELVGDGGTGSWLSEGIKKVVGNKAGSSIEKRTNKAFKTAGQNFKANLRAVTPAVSTGLSFIPGVGPTAATGFNMASGLITGPDGSPAAAPMAAPLSPYKSVVGAAPAPAPAPAPTAPAKSNNTALILGGLAAAGLLWWAMKGK